MQTTLAPGDEDPRGHLLLRRQEWLLERGHLRMQILRQRAAERSQAAARAAASDVRKPRLVHSHLCDDAINESLTQREHQVAGQDQLVRDAFDAERVDQLHRKAHREMAAYRGKLEQRQQRLRAADALAGRRAAKQWDNRMQAAARERALAVEEERLRRERAKRGFRWAQADLKHERAVDRIANRGGLRHVNEVDVRTRLPTTAADAQQHTSQQEALLRPPPAMQRTAQPPKPPPSR